MKPSAPLSMDNYEVLRVSSERQRAIDCTRKDRERNMKMWRLYFGVDGTQWPDEDIDLLESEGRTAAQFNVVEPKIDTLAGSLASEEYDLDWKPIRGSRNSLTESIKESWYSDKELCDFKSQFDLVLRDGLVHLGVLKMHISEKYDPLTNIAFSHREPGYIHFDPFWRTVNDADCEKCWEDYFLDAKQIADRWGVSSPQIESAIKELEKYGGRFEEHEPDFNKQINYLSRGHLYRVTEYHWIETLRTTRLVGQVLNSKLWLPFPITKEWSKLEKFMVLNKVDPETMRESPYNDKIHHVTTICPDATQKVLEDGISKIQCGRLPYFQFCANRANGQNKGIADNLFDLQDTINRRESKLTDLIESANGGGKLVNKDLFENPTELAKFIANANDPKHVQPVDGDELAKGNPIFYIQQAQYQAQIVNQIERMYDVVDRIAKVPAAQEAMSESANESGVLLNRKFQIAKLTQLTISNRVLKMRRDCADAYFWQWQIHYNGDEREFSTRDGKHRTVLNERIFDRESGQMFIKNRPEMVPRCVVICTYSQNSPNQMLADQALYSELLNLSAKFSPAHSSFMFDRLMKTMPLSDKDKAELEEIGLLQKVERFSALKSNVANLNAAEKQSMLMGLNASMQIGQLLGQMGMPSETDSGDDLIAEGEIPKQPDEQSVSEDDALELEDTQEESPEPMMSDVT